jgi:hypothetical protein
MTQEMDFGEFVRRRGAEQQAEQAQREAQEEEQQRLRQKLRAMAAAAKKAESDRWTGLLKADTRQAMRMLSAAGIPTDVMQEGAKERRLIRAHQTYRPWGWVVAGEIFGRPDTEERKSSSGYSAEPYWVDITRLSLTHHMLGMNGLLYTQTSDAWNEGHGLNGWGDSSYYDRVRQNPLVVDLSGGTKAVSCPDEAAYNEARLMVADFILQKLG